MMINLNTVKFNNLSKRNFLNRKMDVPFAFKQEKDSYNFSNISFKGIHCLPNEFKLRDIKNLHCPYCGQIMLNEEQRKEFIEDVASKKGEKLIKTLEKYEQESVLTGNKEDTQSIFRPQKQLVVNKIKELAKQYPDLNIAQLVKLQSDSCLKPLIEEQLAVVGELEDYISKNVTCENELKKLKIIIDEQKMRIQGESRYRFRRKGFIYAIANSVENKDVQEKINSIVEKLPTSDNSVESFFVKYGKGNYSASKIAEKLIFETEPTTEHIIPRLRKTKNVAKGKNSTSNYIVACSGCNGQKADSSILEWQKTHPDFQKNLQEYLVTIQDILDTEDGYDGYETYIQDIISTISKASQDTIQLAEPVSKNNSDTQNKLMNRRQQIAKIKTQLNQNKSALKKQKELLEQIEQSPFFKLLVQHELACTMLDRTNQQINESNSSSLAELLYKKQKYEMETKRLEREIEKYDPSILDNEISTRQSALLENVLADGDSEETQKIQEEIEALSQERNLRAQALNYEEIKDNFEKSTQIADYNDKILMVLANRYKSMTNEELNTWIRKFYL